MDAAQWSEGLGVVKSMEEKKSVRPQKPEALNCPRCNSSHTKFCYYNNYSLSQPRYFCKTCRRYWTEGGSLRNVPVGGGSRRNKRSSSTTSSSSSSVATIAANSISKNQNQMMMVQQVPSLITQNPSKTIIQGQSQSQDLNLGYPTNISLQFGNLPSSISDPSPFSSAMEFLKSGFADPRQAMMNSLPNTMFINSPAGLNFSLDGFQNNGGYHHLQGGGGLVTSHQGTMSTITTTSGTSNNSNARILFPFENLKPISTSNSTELLEATRGQLGESSSGYNWGAGGLGSGGSW